MTLPPFLTQSSARMLIWFWAGIVGLGATGATALQVMGPPALPSAPAPAAAEAEPTAIELPAIRRTALAGHDHAAAGRPGGIRLDGPPRAGAASSRTAAPGPHHGGPADAARAASRARARAARLREAGTARAASQPDP